MAETQTTQPKPQANAQRRSVLDEVDSLAGEFDSQAPPPKPQADPLRVYAERKMHEDAVADRNTSIGNAMAELKGADKLKAMPDRFLKGYLLAYAEDNPDFNKAYDARKQNPNQWKSALAEARKTAEEEFNLPDSKVTSDIEAARASVRGSSSTEPPPPKEPDNDELTAMSDTKFADFKAALDAKLRRAKRG